MDLLISIFATYAILLMLTDTDGPYGVFARLRGNKNLSVLQCDLCAATWIGFVIALWTADTLIEWAILTLALAGAATAMNRIVNGY